MSAHYGLTAPFEQNKSSETAQSSQYKTFYTSTSRYSSSKEYVTHHREMFSDLISRNSRREVFCKKVFLKISQYSQENTCVGVSVNKVAGRKTCNFIKRDFNTDVFP